MYIIHIFMSIRKLFIWIYCTYLVPYVVYYFMRNIIISKRSHTLSLAKTEFGILTLLYTVIIMYM